LKRKPSLKDIALLALIAFATILVNGYHPFAEDAEIYLPGIKKLLNPALYPHNAAFFASHAHMTLFPELIASSVKITHVPLDWALFIWQWFSIFLLLLGCWHISRLAFKESVARWGGVLLVASLLTIPVAGTSLYIMDQYLSTRSFSTPGVLFMIIGVIERKYVRALLWSVVVALIHPLMVLFGLGYAFLLVCMRLLHQLESKRETAAAVAVLLLPFGFFPPMTEAYRTALNSRSYFFLLRWEWYEWLGIFAPLAILWGIRWIARRQQRPVLESMSTASVIFGFVFFAAALVITVPARFANFAELQPMRSLQLVYILLFVFSGGLLAEKVLKNRIWCWLLMFVPICAGMAYAQYQLFPATPHVEWPGKQPTNDWMRAFLWIRHNTPTDSYFALNPNHMKLPGEDQQGFRAVAERSMLADNVKDSGAVTMFPALAEAWQEQVRAQEPWTDFKAADFRRLKEKFGVDWVVLQRPVVTGLSCPYRNGTLLVCHVD
jgi:hypothetical protein